MDCQLVDTLEACQQAVAKLSEENEVVIDIEGVELSRKGEVCLIQMCGASGMVSLFDICAMGEEAFGPGGLRSLLESENVTKLFFDVRSDSDALYHLHGVKVRAAYDIQILWHVRFQHPEEPYLQGLMKVLDKYLEQSHVLSDDAAKVLEQVKQRGLSLFAPEHGGRYEVWKERPLCPDLLEYATADVNWLLEMRRFWAPKDLPMADELNRFVTAESARRLENFVDRPDAEALDFTNNKYRDFDIPDGFNTTRDICEKVQVPEGARGRVIGRCGATMDEIRSSTGARLVLEAGKTFALVVGQRAQVEKAVRMISDKAAGLEKPGDVAERIYVQEGLQRGKVIGNGGATIKSIQSNTVTRIAFEGDEAVVVGQPSQVKLAIHQIKKVLEQFLSGYTQGDGVLFDVQLNDCGEPQARHLCRSRLAHGIGNETFIGKLKSFNKDSHGFISCPELATRGCTPLVFVDGDTLRKFDFEHTLVHGTSLAFKVKCCDQRQPKAFDIQKPVRYFGSVSQETKDNFRYLCCPDVFNFLNVNVLVLKHYVQQLRVGDAVSFYVKRNALGSPEATEVREHSGIARARDTDTFFEGTVKSFNSTKGYGFITCPQVLDLLDTDVFVHQKQMCHYPPGFGVRFRVKLNGRGHPQAWDVAPRPTPMGHMRMSAPTSLPLACFTAATMPDSGSYVPRDPLGCMQLVWPSAVMPDTGLCHQMPINVQLPL